MRFTGKKNLHGARHSSKLTTCELIYQLYQLVLFLFLFHRFRNSGRKLPGSPVVRTARYHCQRWGFDPSLRNKDPKRCQCMAKPIQYCKVKLSNKIIIIKKELTQSELRYLAQGDAAVADPAFRPCDRVPKPVLLTSGPGSVYSNTSTSFAQELTLTQYWHLRVLPTNCPKGQGTERLTDQTDSDHTV